MARNSASSFFFYWVIGALILFNTSCGDDELSEFELAKGFEMDLVAAEPLLNSPVAMVEDENNRFWVVEMPGYMRDIDGSGENILDGKIIILTDTNGDGRMDQRKVFLDSLLNPRALCLVYEGLLYSDGPYLKWTEITNDKPSNTIIVDSLYVVGGNIEHQPNGLLYNIDNWIYSAKSNARYSFRYGRWIKEATSFRGQWGITMDQNGKLIYNHNSAPLIGDHSIPNQILGNPYLEIKHSNGQYLTDDMRVFPIQPTSVNRGYEPGVLDSSGMLINYTSACSPHLFYGSGLGRHYNKTVFVCAPEVNLIANYSYDSDKLEAKKRVTKYEFLVSKDETFRPVFLHSGLDDNLYVVDMRRGIIQHSAYMSSYLRDKIISKGLDKKVGLGRIYRIRQKKEYTHQKKLILKDLNNDELMDLFSHSNLAVRMFAQKKLIPRLRRADENRLEAIAKNNRNPNAQMHALRSLEEFGVLPEFMTEIGNAKINHEVLIQLLDMSGKFHKADFFFESLYKKAYDLESDQLDFTLASLVGRVEMYEHLWLGIAERHPNDVFITEALISSISGKEAYFLSKLDTTRNKLLIDVISETLDHKQTNEIQSPQLLTTAFEDDRTNGRKKFKSYCAACHGLDGLGQKNVAPSLKTSKVIQGPETEIARSILHGYDSGSELYKIPMPAYKEDRNLSDQDIYDIISYLKSAFTDGWNTLKPEEISALR